MKKSIIRSVLLGALLCLSSGVLADDFEEAQAAYRRHDYQRVLQLMQPLAERGDAGAQYILGNLYSKGLGVDKDYRQAARWYTQSAEQGMAQAQFNLALLYAYGRGVQRDTAKAMYLYEQAAEGGLADAMNMIAYRYYHGAGVPVNYVLARKWFERAVAESTIDGSSVYSRYSRYWLAKMYQRGEGGSADPKRAKSLFSEAIPILQRAAEKGDAKAISLLAEAYEVGYGVYADVAKASHLYEKTFLSAKRAATGGHSGNQYVLAELYETGKGTQADSVLALHWYQKSAEGGDVRAIARLVEIYEKGGLGVQKNPELAKRWRDALN